MVMKKILCFILISLSVGLTACSVQEAEQQMDVQEDTKGSTLQEARKEDAVVDYEEILNTYYQVLQERQNPPKQEAEKSDTDDNLCYSIVNPYWAWESAENILSKEGFAFMDLNQDGVEELLLGWIGNEVWNLDEGYVFAIYTIDDGEAVLAIEGWERCLYVIGEDGYLYRNGNSSAWESSYTKCRFNPEWEDFLEPVEEIYSYMGTAGEVCWKYKANSAVESLDNKSALALIEGWIAQRKEPDYTVFSEYGQEAEKVTEPLVFLQDNDLVAAGENYVAMVTPGGEVRVAYAEDRADEEVLSTRWKNVVKLAKTRDFPVAITTEGKLLVPNGRTIADYEQDIREFEASGANGGMFLGMRIENATEMLTWSGLKQVYGEYSELGAFGIFEDGSMQEAGIVGIGLTEEDFSKVQNWAGLKDFAMTYSGNYVAGLFENGEVRQITVGEEKTMWTDGVTWDNIVALESGAVMFFGLTEDGKVLHTKLSLGQDYYTASMEDIVFIAAGYSGEVNCDVVYGIRKDGKVVDRFGKEVPGLEDVIEIAVTDFSNVVIGLRADGTICISDNANAEMKQAVEEWNEE